MKRYFSVVLAIFALICLSLGAMIWIRALYNSAERYASPLAGESLPVQEVNLTPAANVVVVLISGLGYDAFQTLELPTLNQLAQTGATTVIQSAPPTYSQTARMSLVSGAWAEINGVPPIDQPPSIAPAAANADTIFARAKDAGLKTALLGKSDWRNLVARSHLDETFFIDTTGVEADQVVLGAVLPALKDSALNLVWIHFTGLEFAAEFQGGPNGDAYQSAAGRIDNYLGQISRTIDLNNTTLIILGDHGYTNSGGQGGAEIEVSQQPLIMVGSGVIPGNYSSVSQLDIAPTISTLLGVSPPTHISGRVLFEMLNLTEREQTLTQLAVAQQRVALANTYVSTLQPAEEALFTPLSEELEQAATALARNNLDGAFQIALLIQEQADTEMSSARHNKIQQERWPRLLIAAAVLLIWFTVMWRRRGYQVGLIVIATIVTVGLYHVLFQIQGFNYSLSSFDSLSQWPFDIARRIVVSFMVGGGLVLVFLMLVNEKDWVILLGTGYGFSVFVTFVFALPIFLTFWQNGFLIRWYFPSVDLVFWQATALLEVMMTAVLGLILPWPIMALNILVNLARHNLIDNQPKSERDPLPGLRL